MPKVSQEIKQTVVKKAVGIITLTADEVTEIVTEHLKQNGYGLIDGTVIPNAGFEYRGDPNWGIPERPVGIFLGYRAECEIKVQRVAPSGAESEALNG